MSGREGRAIPAPGPVMIPIPIQQPPGSTGGVLADDPLQVILRELRALRQEVREAREPLACACGKLATARCEMGASTEYGRCGRPVCGTHVVVVYPEPVTDPSTQFAASFCLECCEIGTAAGWTRADFARQRRPNR